MSNYFIGYFERFRGYKFYDSTIRSIFETGIAMFFEDVEFGGRNKVRDILYEDLLLFLIVYRLLYMHCSRSKYEISAR